MQTIEVACSERSLEGSFLAKMVSIGTFNDLLGSGKYTAKIYEGGQHILWLLTPARKDVEALLALITEAYSKVVGCTEFVAYVQAKLSIY